MNPPRRPPAAPAPATTPIAAAPTDLVVPLVDVWMGLLSRQRPEGRLVPAFLKLTSERRIVVAAPVLAALAMAASDRRQADRVVRALAPFPVLCPSVDDHLAAAALAQDLRGRQLPIDAEVALAWTLAQRAGARLWTGDRRHLALAVQGCPLFSE